MKGYTLIIGYFCVNLAIWALGMAGILPTWKEPQADPTSLLAMFNLDAFTVITGLVGGTVIGILSMVTRSYALGVAVLVVWVVGVILTPIQDIFTGLPYLISMFLPAELAFLSQIVTIFTGITLFFFIVEIIANRNIQR